MYSKRQSHCLNIKKNELENKESERRQEIINEEEAINHKILEEEREQDIVVTHVRLRPPRKDISLFVSR